jgi:hypothetical protein
MGEAIADKNSSEVVTIPLESEVVQAWLAMYDRANHTLNHDSTQNAGTRVRGILNGPEAFLHAQLHLPDELPVMVRSTEEGGYEAWYIPE